jgi:dsRNA-specific ribonuclease
MDENYKGRLQEYCQRWRLPLPKYQLLEQSGLPHSSRFRVNLLVYSNFFMRQVSCTKLFLTSMNIH